jgi:transposase InsO family protein
VLDDYTKLSSVKCIKHRDDVAAALIHICKSLENKCRDIEGSTHIKAVRSNNGNEFINSEVKAYFSFKGIGRQTTAPYNPQSNGSAECLNRVLWQKSTAMLLAANLSEGFWSHDVEAANYVRNRSPHKATPGNNPPYAMFRGSKPSIAHLRIFGCACYPVLDLASRSKFKSNVVKGVFMGY